MAIKVLSVDSSGIRLDDLCCILLSVPGWTTSLISLVSLLAVMFVPGVCRGNSSVGRISSPTYQIGRGFGFTLPTSRYSLTGVSQSGNDQDGSEDAKPTSF